MPKGGARNRSGPQPDPGSLRSAKRDFQAQALPREGFRGRVPVFPLADVTERELEVWKQTWRTPQAAAWALEPWRHRTVAQYVRYSVRMESRVAPASIGTLVLRLADQIGLTPAGLRENGWAIARDETAAARAAKAAEQEASKPAARSVGPSARERMRAVDGAGGA